MVNLKEEKKLWKKGYRFVVGLDESGRGPLAGPVVAAAVAILNPKLKYLNPKQYLNPNSPNPKQFGKLEFGIWNLFRISDLEFRIFNEIKDSKKLSQKKRELLYHLILKSPNIEWATGRVGPKVIDRINILEATKLAMERAIKKLKTKSEKRKIKIDYLILDGNFKINLPISQKSIIKADEKVFSVAAASILAKVNRDRTMQRYHKKYPQYGFNRHKGYPTKLHRKMLKKYGPCKIHRKSFKPVKGSQKLKAKS